jgi:uncharacterized protein (DUF3820 family)
MSTITCPHCGGALELTAARRQPGHHDPPRERKPWEKPPQPWSLERARAFTMPFGKHEGKTMAEIAQADRGYVRWAAEKCSNRNVQKAAMLILESQAAPAGARASSGQTSADEFDEFTDPEQ